MDKKELFKKYWFVGLVALVLLVFVSVLQTLGNTLSRRTTNKALFHRNIKTD